MAYVPSYLDEKVLVTGATNCTSALDTSYATEVLAGNSTYISALYQEGGGVVEKTYIDEVYLYDTHLVYKDSIDVAYKVSSLLDVSLFAHQRVDAPLSTTANVELGAYQPIQNHVNLRPPLSSVASNYVSLPVSLRGILHGFTDLIQNLSGTYEVGSFSSAGASLEVLAYVSIDPPIAGEIGSHTELTQDLLTSVGAFCPIRNEILTYTPVSGFVPVISPIRDTQVTILTHDIVVTVSGETIPLLNFEISIEEGEPVFDCSFSTGDVARRYLMKANAPIVATVAGDSFYFYLDSYRVDRSSPSGISIEVQAVSYGAYYEEPRVDKVTNTWETDTLASTIVSELLAGASVAWGIVDWVIPAYRVAIDGGSPMGLAVDIVEAAGGVLEPDYAGGFTARYLHPQATNIEQTSDFEVTTGIQILQMPERMEIVGYSDMYRILDVDIDDFTDTIQYEADEDSEDQRRGTLRVWPFPYDETVTVSHTGDVSDVLMSRTGIVVTDVVDEIVEIVEGVGNTQYPITSIDGFTWLSRNLLGVVFEPYTSELITTHETEKYSLIRISYKTTAIHYRTETATSEAVQFLVNRSE